VTAHASTRDFFRHSLDASHKSPTQVVKIDKKGKVEEIYLGDGGDVSGGSVGMIENNIFIIGSVLDIFMVCELK